jgi:hypothetical protein
LLCRHHGCELEISLYPPYCFFSRDYSVFGCGSVAFSEANSNITMNIYAHVKTALTTALMCHGGKVLAIDEVGYLPLDDLGATIFFQLVSARYERGSIILTSNKSYGNRSLQSRQHPVLPCAVYCLADCKVSRNGWIASSGPALLISAIVKSTG